MATAFAPQIFSTRWKRSSMKKIVFPTAGMFSFLFSNGEPFPAVTILLSAKLSIASLCGEKIQRVIFRRSLRGFSEATFRSDTVC